MSAPDGDPDARAERSRAGRPYAGIGSRQTPSEMLSLMESLAGRLAADGWVLRSGASPGADQAFFRGARRARTRRALPAVAGL